MLNMQQSLGQTPSSGLLQPHETREGCPEGQCSGSFSLASARARQQVWTLWFAGALQHWVLHNWRCLCAGEELLPVYVSLCSLPSPYYQIPQSCSCCLGWRCVNPHTALLPWVPVLCSRYQISGWLQPLQPPPSMALQCRVVSPSSAGDGSTARGTKACRSHTTSILSP